MIPVGPVSTIRVVIVDDHELLRGGIRFALLTAPDIEIVAEANRGEDALRICRDLQPDVVLMDMKLPGELDGVATTQALHALCPKTRILGLSAVNEPGFVRRFIEAGALGFITKGASPVELGDAIRATHQGKSTLSAESLAALLRPLPAQEPPAASSLTPREREVLHLLAQGKTNAQIAETLVVSIAAVKYHVGNILSKLGLANRTEVAAYVRTHNL